MFKIWPVVAIGIALAVLPAFVYAADNAKPVLIKAEPKELSGDTAALKKDRKDALYLTSDKDILVRLDQDAASIIVNNPAHASIILDSPRLLIVMPRQPGATSFTVLNATGDIILEKDIIVSNVQSKYIRIRKMCTGNDASCQPAAYYYCPDGCYDVTPVVPTAGAGNVPPPPASVAAKEALESSAAIGGGAGPAPEAAAPNPGGTAP